MVTISLKHCFPSKVDSHSINHKILHLSYTLKDHYHVHSSLQLYPSLSHINLLRNFTPSFLQNNLNIIFHTPQIFHVASSTAAV
jgi:hypothetical protein